jgi:hypothetical protein
LSPFEAPAGFFEGDDALLWPLGKEFLKDLSGYENKMIRNGRRNGFQ